MQADLTSKVSGLTANISDAATLSASLTMPTIGIQASLSLPGIGAGVSANLSASLAPLGASIALLFGVKATLEAGLSAGGLSAWSYLGPASYFGAGIPTAWPGAATSTFVKGAVVATQSPTVWQALGSFFNVGPAGIVGLTSLGQLSAGQLSTGLVSLDSMIGAQLALKQALFARLTESLSLALSPGSISLSAYVTPPKFSLSAGAGIAANISGITAQIQSMASLASSLSASLQAGASGGGLSAWVYAGAASGLGPALTSALASGLPSGSGPMATVYGLAIAASPAIASAFGNIFLMG